VEELSSKLDIIRTNKKKLEAELNDVDSSINYLENKENEISKVIFISQEIVSNKTSVLNEA